MADEAIPPPPFPPLTWDGYAWSGEITLPSWAGFQSRRGAYASVSSQGPSDGTIRFTVTSLDDDSRTRPTPEQAVAFAYLIDHEAAVAAAVGRALVGHYGGSPK